ncbi:SurA N-terminal domain-containing protein [Streptomyces himalayensis]|uniref:SurA N-terminal domain-containing protein n=1 Tax=Streptomyces himalayensis subsp. himalayensis TaxID=2756131 RepID=A0A7W0DRD0_9ACTN|nr:SurA N-terminal domain-containing protein [Streptomyces himalayensis]MBA2949868.1 SurA N-terminal domain-containing protein [Streptomyces himalayensis subsp. himalayensis]
MHRRRRRIALAVSSAALLAATPLLTACGNDARPGAAAVVGGDRITVAQLEGRVAEVRDAQRAASADEAQYAQAIAATGGLSRDTLHTLVLDRVVHRAAADAGVRVTRKQVQGVRSGLEQQAGGAKQLEAAWLQQYSVAPARVDEALRTEIEAQELAKRLGADMNTSAGQATFWKALSDASKALNIDLNPRYGTWDVDKSRRADAKTPWIREVTSAGDKQA